MIFKVNLQATVKTVFFEFFSLNAKLTPLMVLSVENVTYANRQD
ncbi:hypothetical protein CPS_1935 [Colwellia psychrerythraea 34H]|uniref:Uncharacterized protein n=1 Tax=Colwellia psychrerythraea (strain 34H / ATCC BAA-681) TaxID=167879 RepID=Q483V1_COLP3|nr:hypothetical protein CPS_1935 [Colwellia psychrerythraea 34H]